MARKTAIQKLNVEKEPHVVSPIPAGFPGAKDHDSMVVSTPREVDALLKEVPAGRLVTLTDIRVHLAQRHGADMACPVSTAIFANIAAAAAEEMRDQGMTAITPYWRMIKPDGTLNPKFPGGVEAQQQKLEAEGFTIRLSKKGYSVVDYREFLFRW
jgi:alkylated DNA nucleotide flippase Atl1